MNPPAGTARFAPPKHSAADHVLRGRLIAALRERFDRRLMFLLAPAGFGKTTLLGQAVAQNALEPVGTDIWITIQRNDTPSQVLHDLFHALELPVDMNRKIVSLDDVTSAIWAMAPAEVCVILDDAHLVQGTETEQLIAELLDALPSNGHMVLGTREPLNIGGGRLAASGQQLEIGKDELAFSDAELGEVCQQHPDFEVDGLAEVAYWPALMALSVRGGRDLRADYLWDELLDGLDQERVEALALAALFDEFDDELLDRITGGIFTSADKLLDDLPLVDRFDSGGCRMHGLWAEALAGRVDGDREAAALREGATLLLERRHYRAAAAASLRIDDMEGVRAAAWEEAIRPLTRMNLQSVRFFISVLEPTPLHALTMFFRATEHWCGDEKLAVPSLWEALELALQESDKELEGLILYRLLQALALDRWEDTPELNRALDDLGDDGGDMAAQAHWLRRVRDSIVRREQRTSDDMMSELRGIGGPLQAHYTAEYLGDLGRPEQVDVGIPELGELDAATAKEVRAASELFIGQAMWLRGDAPPEIALALSHDMRSRTHQRKVGHQTISQLGVYAMIAAAAGDLTEARHCRDGIVPAGLYSVGRNIQTFHELAKCAVALLEHDEDTAAHAMADAVELAPVNLWPYRSFLYSMTQLYLLHEPSREALDGFKFGPSIMTAIAAGRALVTLRESGATAPAGALPWERVNLLRAHVSPPLLAELAVAASLADNASARQLLDSLPDAAAHLLYVAGRHTGRVSTEAKQLAKLHPARPREVVSLSLLGSVRLERDGVAQHDAGWRRGRVQELLAYLALHPNTSRRQAAEALWPDLDPEAGLNNLRVHLSHLNGVLEPDRLKAAPTWYVRGSGDQLAFRSEDLVLDVTLFSEAFDVARDADKSGMPQVALKKYEEAMAYYAGDLLAPMVEADWAELDRVALRSKATIGATRIGELNLARGEPEDGLEWARRALFIEPLSQRAARLFVQCLRGGDDEAAASRAIDEILQRYERNVVSMETETERLFFG